MAWNISKTKRQALVKLQLRDKDGKFIEMGGGVKWYSSRLKKVVAGTVVGSKGENALVRLNKENPTHEPALVSVPAASIQAIDGKASLSPKGEPTADETPEFEKPEAVADVEADPNAEADSDHESQLKGPQHLAANYAVTETSDGNTYISRNDGEPIYSPARALKVGDELIAPAGADPTKPFSIGRGWATKGTERLNKEGEGPVVGKVIAISENRYAVVQMAGGHTIADRRNPEEQTDTVTVGLSNQVILATMGLKDSLGDRVSSQTYAERPSDEEKEVAPDAPEAQSDHEGREVPEDQLEAEGEAAPVDRAQVLKDMPVGGRIMSTDGIQTFEKRNTNQWALISGDGELITDDDVLGMVEQGEQRGMSYGAQEPADDESAPEATEAPESQPAPESPAEEAPEAVEEAPATEAPVEEAPEAPEEAPQAKATPVNDIVEGLAELEQAAEDVDGAGLDDEESEEVLNGASFDVTAADGTRQTVTAEKDENGDWNFVVADENGAEVSSHIIGSEENRVLAEKISKGSAAAPEKEAAPEEAAPEVSEAPVEEAPQYNENGLTKEEQAVVNAFPRMIERAERLGQFEKADKLSDQMAQMILKGNERTAAGEGQSEESAAPETPTPVTGPTDAEKIANAEKMYGTGSPQHEEAKRRFGAPESEAPAPAEKEETVPESAPEPEKAPEVTPEETKPVEDAPAPSLVEPDAAPEAPEKPLLNGEEGYVPIDGRGLKDNQKAEEAPAKPEPFGITMERRPDGLDHAVASRPEAFTPEEAEEFRKLDIELTWAQHENRSGREATVRGKLKALDRRVQSRLDTEAMARHKNDGPAPVKDSVAKKAPETAKEAPKPSPPKAKEAPESAPKSKPEKAPEEPADSEEEPTPLSDEEMGDLRERLNGPSVNEDGLLPDEAARLTDLENRQAAAYRGESNEDPNVLDNEIVELIHHGRLRGRGREVGPFVARNPAPDPAPAQDSQDTPEPTPEVTPEAVPSEDVAPAPRRARGSEAVPVADADGNMVTRGDKVGHPTLGPVEITKTIPGSGRVEFIDPTTGRKKSVKAARVRKIDPNAAEAAPEEQPTTAAPGERFVDAATGKQGFGDKNGNRVLVGDRVRDSNGNTGTVKSVYTAASGGAWIPVKWDSDGKTRRAMGNVLEKDDSTEAPVTPEAAPEPIEVVRPSATPAPAPERVEPAEEPFEPVLPSATPAPAPEAVPEAETHETGTARRQALVEATPVNSKITSDDGTQNYYKISDTQWQFNEGNLLTPIAVVNMLALGERRGQSYEIAEGRPAEANAPAAETPVVDAPQAPAGTVLAPDERERRIGMLRQLPTGTTIKPRSGEYTLTKNGSDDWTSTVDDGVYDTEDIYEIVARGREGGLLYEVTRPSQAADPVPTADLAPIALTPDSLVPPTVASRLEAFRRAPVGTTVTSPGGTTTYTKAGDDEWTNPDITGATIKNSTLAIATDSDNGHWVFNKTGPIEPEGVNITAMTATDKLAAFRMAPIGSKLVSTGGKVITKVGERLWTTDRGTEYMPSDLVFVTAPAQTGISGPFGLVLPENPVAPETPSNALPGNRAERLRVLRGLPVGTKVSVRQFTFVKRGESDWELDGSGDTNSDNDVSWAGSEAAPGVITLPEPKPIPQDVESRIRVSEEAPVGTVVTSSSGESYTKIDDAQWADTATGNFKYGLGEFASKIKNNEYTGDYFVTGFDVPEPTPEPFAGGPMARDGDELERQVKSLPVGATITGGRNNSTFVRREADVWSPENNPEEYYNDADLAWRLSLGYDTNVPVAALPEAAPALPVINDQLPVGAFVPSAAGSTSGVKRVGDDKWEMIKDGQPTGRFVNDEAVSVIQELVGTDVDMPVDNRFGNNVGMYAEDLKLPGGKSLGKYLEDGGTFGRLTQVQKKALEDGYRKFVDNLNTQLPEGFRAELDSVSFGSASMETSVQFYDKNGRAVNPASRRFSLAVDDRTGKQVSAVDHAYWHLADDAQGSGLSAAFLAASKQMYRQMGLDRITVHADISVGSYAWARGGFDFVSRHHVGVAMRAWEGAWGRAPRGREQEWIDGIAEFNRLKALATPAAFMNKTHPPAVLFANIGRPTDPAKTGPNDTWFGKAMLSNTHWWGAFNLNPNG